MNEMIQKDYTFIIFIGLMGILGIGVLFLCIAFFTALKKTISQKIYSGYQKIKILREKLILTWSILKHIFHNYNSRTTEFVFQSFIHFYEQHYSDMEHWEFDAHFFPNGKNDLMHMYKWIKKIRPENFKESDLLFFDDTTDSFKYWGSSYESFSFKIDKEGILKINPIEYIEADSKNHVFKTTVLKVQTALYSLDTEMVQWILERRKFFAI